jgi:gamma-polyglutamate synthase
MFAESIMNSAKELLDRMRILSGPSINQLVWFTSIVLALFLIRLMVRRYRIRYARLKLPMSVGGWGTRGKSGTERKKTALFQALGYHVVSKTTGCEAAIIRAKPGLDAVEIPIYRPGNKASIWEQEKVVRWASQMKAQIFLWECMALGSDYAGLMQHSWMKDDWSTISNTFVDHENIQGPSGIDIPRSMKSFIPDRSVLFTAEESMLPVLQDHTRQMNTDLISLDNLESELLSDDLLDLFPYTVHPRNLGLIQNILRYFDINEDMAFREIARHIVPDLGSFKCYRVQYRERQIEYWNGMSANDRTSSLGNWSQAGFNSIQNDQGVWSVTVVNNRDDRIIRSREFAETLVNYTPANLHVLIGTNLNGLYGYIQDSIKHFARQYFLTRDNVAQFTLNQVRERVEKYIHQILEWFRIDGISRQQIENKAHRMLSAVSCNNPLTSLSDDVFEGRFNSSGDIEGYLADSGVCDPEQLRDIAAQIFRDLKDHEQIVSIRKTLQSTFDHSELSNSDIQKMNGNMLEFIKNLMNNRLLIIRDAMISGDDIIRLIVRNTPPGYRIKMIGMQNIKGTGLGFAYRWVSLEKVISAIEKLNSSKIESRISAATLLSAHDDYGLLDTQLALNALEEARNKPENDTPEMITILDEALKRLSVLTHKKNGNSLSKTGGLKTLVSRLLEQLLELGDSKRRQRTVRKVMKDLVNERISSIRAAKIIHDMNKRQDGGWLDI